LRPRTDGNESRYERYIGSRRLRRRFPLSFRYVEPRR
jgi:hypothetical protein